MSTSSTERPAGWYPHPRDPPGTRREWDGSKWVGEAVMSPEPIEQDDKHRTRLAGSLALHFVDPPQVIQTSAGLKVKITVLNGGPVDALFAFDLRVDGGIVQVTNPQAVIQTGGPVRLDLSVPLDSSITTNTKLTVSASTKGGQLVTISSASVTSGGIFSGSVGAVLAAGVISLGDC